MAFLVHYLDCAFFYAIGSYDFINVAIKNEYYLSKMYTPEGVAYFLGYGFVNLLRRTIHSAAVGSVLFVAPFQRLPVEVCKITEHPVSQEIVLHKTHQSLHFSLGEGMPWLAKFCLEGKGLHKGFVVFLPDWMAIQISVQYNALHVVG